MESSEKSVKLVKDKHEPNDYRTAKRVVESIEDALTEEDADPDLKMQIIFGSPISDKIINDLPHQFLHIWKTRECSKLFLKRCLSAWRLWSIGQAQELRRANRLALSLHLRSLLRSWRRTVGESLQVEVSRAQELLRHQERKKLRYVRERMLHLRATCLFKMRTFRWTARVAQLALFEWHIASRVSRLARSVSLREKQESFQKVVKCFKTAVRNGQSARHVAQQQHVRLLADVLLSWQHTVKLKAERTQHFRSKAKDLRDLRLRQNLVTWHNQFRSLNRERVLEASIRSNRRLRMLSQAFTLLKDARKLAQKTRKVLQKLRTRQAQQGLQAFKLNADRLRRMRAVSSKQKCFVSRNRLKSWKLLYQFREKVTKLAATQQLFAQQLLTLWLHGCAMSEIFCSWQRAVKLLIREAQAAELHRMSLKRHVASVFRAWLASTESLKLQRRTRLRRFELLWLGRFILAWQGHLVNVRLIELHRKEQLLKAAKQILLVWRHNCHALRQFRVLQFRKSIQLCAPAFCLWRVVRLTVCIQSTAERQLRIWTLSSWAQWAALRRQVRDDVAWQRWADGIVDLFSTRRLLLGLPTCFASWSHFHRFRKARRTLAFNKQLQQDRQIAQIGFAALRRNLALSRFSKVDRLLGRVQASQMLQLLLRLRKVSRISSQSDTVAALHRHLCKARALRGLHRVYQQRCSSRQACRLRSLTTTWSCWLKAVRAQVRRKWLPALFAEWGRVCKSLQLQRHQEQRYGLRRWKGFDSLGRLKERWSDAEVTPGLRKIGFMSELASYVATAMEQNKLKAAATCGDGYLARAKPQASRGAKANWAPAVHGDSHGKGQSGKGKMGKGKSSKGKAKGKGGKGKVPEMNEDIEVVDGVVDEAIAAKEDKEDEKGKQDNEADKKGSHKGKPYKKNSDWRNLKDKGSGRSSGRGKGKGKTQQVQTQPTKRPSTEGLDEDHMNLLEWSRIIEAQQAGKDPKLKEEMMADAAEAAAAVEAAEAVKPEPTEPSALPDALEDETPRLDEVEPEPHFPVSRPRTVADLMAWSAWSANSLNDGFYGDEAQGSKRPAESHWSEQGRRQRPRTVADLDALGRKSQDLNAEPTVPLLKRSKDLLKRRPRLPQGAGYKGDFPASCSMMLNS
eukprot:s2162_g7.t1